MKLEMYFVSMHILFSGIIISLNFNEFQFLSICYELKKKDESS